MTTTSNARAPGVFVLGMHRSGTSVMAGILDRLGLDGGPRESMLVADEFNSDGYWEQRPLVEMHDRMLRRLGGFASAPPIERDTSALHRALPTAESDIAVLVSSLFDGPWFVKDPRHCLLLPLWTSALGERDLAMVILRSPDAVVRSLQHRNGYPPQLALGLWERYTIDLLSGIEGRPTMIVRYEDLVRRPRETVESIIPVLESHIGSLPTASVEHAAGLVREREARTARSHGASSHVSRRLHEIVTGIVGYHSRFTLDDQLPVQSRPVRQRLARRRLALRFVGSVMGHDAISRSQLDRRRSLSTRHLRSVVSS